MSLLTKELKKLLQKALAEDCPGQDITSAFFLKAGSQTTARLIAKEPGLFYGEEIIQGVFQSEDPSVQINVLKDNGQVVKKGDMIAQFSGSVTSILKAERVMLNLLQRLSGIASLTAQYVKALNNPSIKVLDTRKTTPLWRFLEKKAVVAGGGFNHRENLSDMVLLKENHLSQMAKDGTLKNFGKMVKAFKQTNPNLDIEVEIETLDQLETLSLEAVDFILLDNFELDLVEKAVEICKRKKYKAQIEVSGNITLDTIKNYSKMPIQRISVGSLTHSAKALDLSLLVD